MAPRIGMDGRKSTRHEDFKHDMKAWILDGSVRPLKHLYEGLEQAPEALHGLFEGHNVGKSIVQVTS